ncbi:uncharacterized protein ACIGJ3_014167 isoform 2-T15 [Trichechus inunguis]
MAWMPSISAGSESAYQVLSLQTLTDTKKGSVELSERAYKTDRELEIRKYEEMQGESSETMLSGARRLPEVDHQVLHPTLS